MAERGTKRKCASCGASYYDLNKTPIRCPKCDAPYVASAPLRGTPLRGRIAAVPPPPVDIEPRDEAEEEQEAPSEGSEEFEEAEDLPSDDENFGTGDEEERD